MKKVLLGREEYLRNTLGAINQRYSGIEQIWQDHRPYYSAEGVNELQATHHLFQWAAALNNPATKVDAALRLLTGLGINIQMLGVPHADLVYENQQLKLALQSGAQMVESRESRRIAAEVEAFKEKYKPSEETKQVMAKFMQSSPVTLEEAHGLAMTHLASKRNAEAESKRKASVSPKGSTSYGLGKPPARTGKRDRMASNREGIKGALLDAFKRTRAGERY
jgi:hypothetical protein